MTLEEFRARRNKLAQDNTGPSMSDQQVDLQFVCAVGPSGSPSAGKDRDLCPPAEWRQLGGRTGCC